VTWSVDGKTIYTTAANLGQTSLFAIETATSKARTVVKDGHVRSVALAGARLLFGMDHHRSPVELYSILPSGSDVRQITGINAGKLAKVRMGESEQFTFKGWNDETVYAYVVKPVDFDPNKKYPVAFLIHGGPQGSFGNDFHYRWNPQAYAGAGYAAVMVDFHGSTGYGQAFCDAIRGDWGGKPLEDLQKGLAAALARYPWMDGDRVGALGASYGGYMINWIAGNWPDRFRCLVSHDGNLDERMAYFDTEELWFPEWDHQGNPWDNPKNYTKHNPIDHIKKWKTPMLVIHSALDYRVVYTQGISTFTALQRRGIPSKFLYFPDENHWVLKPHNSILWHETVIGWLDQWVKGEGTN
jgi:dipeptidyl aminopeptidase/acylaminoacyl peptidase